MSCSEKQSNNTPLGPNANLNENEYRVNDVYDYGDLKLLKKSNLPLTGFLLDHNNDGGLSSKQYFINGRQEGKELYYYKDGSLQREANYKNGLENGTARGWHENGRKSYERQFMNGNQDGKQVVWYENGQINEISNYKNGLRVGWQRTYFENGEVLFEVNLVNGNGTITNRSVDNSVQITEKYVSGEMLNPIDNDEKDLSNYKNGLVHGKNSGVFKNGQLSYEEEYFFGQRDGTHQAWYENGKLAEIRKYDKGILISAKCWDESGKEMECDCYDNGGRKIKCP
jgi:antitoxin component YwqK of YwqJK toxin-antitoxin module